LAIGASRRIGYAGLRPLLSSSVNLVSRLTGYFRRQTLKATDQRVQLMNELLICMKLIKMYAWEKPFAKSIKSKFILIIISFNTILL
jgi:hypothetical protein